MKDFQMRKLAHSSKEEYDRIMNRAHDWYKQAADDLRCAEDTLKAGHYAQACFIAQQVAEKSLKATALANGYDTVRSHSAKKICEALGINGKKEMMAKRLDQYYISARYPDAFSEGSPFEFFTEEQARQAVQFGEEFLKAAGEAFHDSP